MVVAVSSAAVVVQQEHQVLAQAVTVALAISLQVELVQQEQEQVLAVVVGARGFHLLAQIHQPTMAVTVEMVAVVAAREAHLELLALVVAAK
jgi:predicted membrane chloride channel (bestrophin family)